MLKIENILKCDECQEKFKEKSDMNYHMLSKHNVKMFKCEVCGVDHKTVADVKIHMTKAHSEVSQKGKLFKNLC